MSSKSIIGTWRLVSYEIRNQGGAVMHPLGERPVGFLIYTPEGRMFGTLMAKDRPRFTSKEYMYGSPEEKSWALETFISYCGTYEHLGNRVVHHVEASWYPNWTGTDQMRSVNLRNDRLTLTSPTFLYQGKESAAELVWEKM